MRFRGKGYRWRGVLVRMGTLFILLLGGLFYLLDMPGETHKGRLAPLSAAETEIRDQLMAHVRMLAGTIGERNLWHYEGLVASANYIESTLARLGFAPSSENFETRGKPVRNLVAEKRGNESPETIILVGAHYDSVVGSPGANDNGSGVAALLELARLLADQDLRRTVRFVAFVNEEPPFSFSSEMGSMVHAKAASARGDRIEAMLSLETLGYYSEEPGSQQYPFPLNWFYPETANFIGFVGNLGSRQLVRTSLRSFRRYAPFPAEGASVPESFPGVGWSDHWSFWQAGYRGIMVTDTAFYRYAHYHTAEDTPDKIDYERTARVVFGLSSVVSDLASNPSISN